MLLIDTFVAPSAVHGLGVFCVTDVAAGTVVWDFDPRIDHCLTEHDVAALPGPARTYLARFGYRDRRTGLWVLCGDDARFTNHALIPTLLDVPNDRFGLDVAAYDLPAGTELTNDYRAWDDGTHPVH